MPQPTADGDGLVLAVMPSLGKMSIYDMSCWAYWRGLGAQGVHHCREGTCL